MLGAGAKVDGGHVAFCLAGISVEIGVAVGGGGDGESSAGLAVVVDDALGPAAAGDFRAVAHFQLVDISVYAVGVDVEAVGIDGRRGVGALDGRRAGTEVAGPDLRPCVGVEGCGKALFGEDKDQVLTPLGVVTPVSNTGAPSGLWANGTVKSGCRPLTLARVMVFSRVLLPVLSGRKPNWSQSYWAWAWGAARIASEIAASMYLPRPLAARESLCRFSSVNPPCGAQSG